MDIGNVDNRLRSAVDVEHAAVEAVGIKAREHAVEHRLRPFGHAGEQLYARNTRETHILGDFHGVGAPGGYHFPARADETAFERSPRHGACAREGPLKFLLLDVGEAVVGLHCIDGGCTLFEKLNHENMFGLVEGWEKGLILDSG